MDNENITEELEEPKDLKICPECGGRIVNHDNEKYCKKCGLVFD